MVPCFPYKHLVDPVKLPAARVLAESPGTSNERTRVSFVIIVRQRNRRPGEVDQRVPFFDVPAMSDSPDGETPTQRHPLFLSTQR